jgi:hypothetical protein
MVQQEVKQWNWILHTNEVNNMLSKLFFPGQEGSIRLGQ